MGPSRNVGASRPDRTLGPPELVTLPRAKPIRSLTVGLAVGYDERGAAGICEVEVRPHGDTGGG